MMSDARDGASGARRVVRRCALVAGLLALVVAPVIAQPVTGDTTGSVVRIRTTRTVLEGTGPRARPGAGLLIRRQGARQRADVLAEVSDTSGSAWMSMDDLPARMRLHDLDTRTTVDMRFDDLRTLFTSLLRARFDSATSEAEVRGPGPTVLGHATQRVLFRQAFRMQTTRGTATQVLRITSETDALIAPDVPESFGGGSAVAITTGSQAALIEQVFGTGAATVTVRRGGPLPHGLALRAVTRTEMRATGDGSLLGAAGVTITLDTAEVLSVERRTHPAALFEAPTGYRVVDFGAQLRSMVALVDSLQASVARLSKGAKPAGGAPRRPSKPLAPGKTPPR